ncbi:MAG: DNA polymerase III subunit delta' [Acidobacteriota bacterium]
MFEDLIGNEQIKQVAERLIRSGRVPNSMLFAGDEGVGKRLFAIEIAKAFVCTDPGELLACGVCGACRRVNKFDIPTSEKGEDYDRVFFSEHPDVGLVVPYKRNVRIGAIRYLEKEANYNPYEARSRVFIVDAAEKMADPAANALLKTLEEPASTSHIFLITSRPDSLLPTIRSRCQILRFAPVPTHDIERFLVEKRSMITEEADLAARLGRGSIGRAVSIDVEKFRVRRDRMLGVVRSSLNGHDISSLLRISEEMNDAKNKENFEESLDILESLIHDVWSLRISDDATRVVNTDVAAELSSLARDAAAADLPRWLSDIETMREQFAVNINRKVATDALFVSMASN